MCSTNLVLVCLFAFTALMVPLVDSWMTFRVVVPTVLPLFLDMLLSHVVVRDEGGDLSLIDTDIQSQE